MRCRARIAAAVLILLLLPTSIWARDPRQDQRDLPGVALRDIPGQVQPYATAGFDLLVLRPLGVVALGVGSVLFVPAAALSALDRQAFGEALDIFVLNQAKNTFTRPLGDF